MSLKSKQQGFTIVELLIVIVVIGILAALVITTFTGIQKKARDTERTTDIKALHGQLEAYQASAVKYPTLAEFNDTTWRTTNMKGLDPEALRAPAGNGTLISAASTIASYSYVPAPAGCDNTATDCTSYTLTAQLEVNNSTFSKNSLN